MDLAVIGSSEFVLGFRLSGIKKVYDITDDNLVSKVQDVINDPDVGILVMHNDDLAKLPAQLNEALNESVEPTVVAIGGESGSSNLREKIKQSVGVDLWK